MLSHAISLEDVVGSSNKHTRAFVFDLRTQCGQWAGGGGFVTYLIIRLLSVYLFV